MKIDSHCTLYFSDNAKTIRFQFFFKPLWLILGCIYCWFIRGGVALQKQHQYTVYSNKNMQINDCNNTLQLSIAWVPTKTQSAEHGSSTQRSTLFLNFQLKFRRKRVVCVWACLRPSLSKSKHLINYLCVHPINVNLTVILIHKCHHPANSITSVLYILTSII